MSSGHKTHEPIEVLLVEDSPSDALLTMTALEQGKVRNTIHHVTDGEQAMAYLRNEGEYADAPRPDIVLLDLNMPRKDGREVLEEMSADANLNSIPVVVLTTSEDEKDILISYQRNANCYISKPVDFKKFSRVIQLIDDFWFSVVKLPPKD